MEFRIHLFPKRTHKTRPLCGSATPERRIAPLIRGINAMNSSDIQAVSPGYTPMQRYQVYRAL
jgi:hypothetical protein